MPRPRILARRSLGGAVAALLALAGSASAAMSGNNLGVVTASSGEMAANFVSGNGGAAVPGTWSLSSPSAGDIRLTLTGAGGSWDLHAGAGCNQTAATQVTCSATTASLDLHGMTAAQTLQATGAFDVLLIGGSGADSITGGGGNDRLRGMRGGDTLSGGGGIDSADYTSQSPEDATVRQDGVTVTIGDGANDGRSTYDGTSAGGLGADNVTADTENVLGTDHADTLSGSTGPNLLSGYQGNDTLTGGPGSDMLNGSWGDDTLYANDGEADAEVNCNNSDGSGAQQPNTAHYDSGLDSPANCSVLVPSGGGDSGDSTGGGSGPIDATQALQAGSIPTLEQSGTWIIPASMEPVFVKSGPGGKSRWDFTGFPSLRSASKEAPFPIRIERKYVGSNKVPSAQRRFVSDGDIVGITPAGGTTLTGSSRRPASMSVTIYDELLDIKRGSCPYRGKALGNKTLTEALNTSKGLALGSATRKLTTMKCTWTIVGSRLANDDEPAAVSFIKSAVVAKLGPSKYVVRLNVVHPRQGLDLVLGPRDPATLAIGGNKDFAARASREMTLDERGMLRRSQRTITTISVQPIVRSVAKPVRSQTRVTLTAKDGTVLASQEARTPNGVTTLSFTVPKTPYVTVRVTTTEDDGVSSLHGEKRITVKGRSGTIRTIDGRCFRPAPDEKWAVTTCPVQAGSAELALQAEGPAVTPLPYAVRWKVIDILLGDEALPAPPTRARALAICEAATPASSGGFRLVVDQLGPGRCLADASMQALIREFKLVPALIGAKPEQPCTAGLQGANAPVSYQPAAAFVDGTLRSGSTPAAKLDGCGVLGVYLDGKFFLDQTYYLATQTAVDGKTLINLDGGNLINLDGGTLINLDGGTLINLDGGTLINLDGGTLINLDGGTLQGAVLKGKDGLLWGAQTPPALIGDRGAGLISDMGGAFLPLRVDPSLVDVGARGLITKPRLP